MSAFSRELAGESRSDAIKGKWDKKSKTYLGITHDELIEFARTIAYKVAYNLSNGSTMDPDNDPLTYIDCGEEKREPWSPDPDAWRK
jgi:hypothetical protein